MDKQAVRTYIRDNLSFEPVQDYLANRQENPTRFRQISVIGSARTADDALEVLAQRAIVEGCKYIAHVHTIATRNGYHYTEMRTTPGFGGAHPEEMDLLPWTTIAGTGLIEKSEKQRK
jgi:hypothetical protein